MVKAKIRERISNAHHKAENKRRKWNSEKFKREDEKEKYQTAINNKLQMEKNQNQQDNSIEDRLNRIEKYIKEAAEDIIGRETKHKRNEWFDEDCQEIIRDKNTARLKMVQKETRGNYETYKEIRNKATKLCRKKKK